MEIKDYLKIEELTSGLQEVVRINSEGSSLVKMRDGSTHPFGSGVFACLEKVLQMGTDMGFSVANIDNYGGHIDFVGTEDKVLGILGHLDVVPAGDGWSHEPYSGDIVDGYMYGRGTTDDKGPLISCLYAMKALKDSGFTPKPTIRLILGLDEETNWEGINYYFSKVNKPDFGFTPDAEFPIINGEKGIVNFDFAKKFAKTNVKGLELRTIMGGTAPNAVASSCRAVLRNENIKDPGYENVKDVIEEFRKETGYKVNYKGVGKALEITATGIAAHGAKPEEGLNAISIMMALLSKFNFVNESAGDFIEFYNRYIGFDLDGKGLGINLEDEKSGKLTFNVGLIDLNPNSVKMTVNVRYPVSFTDKDVYDPLTPIIEKYDIGIVRLKHEKPIYLDLDNPLVKTLLDCYARNTGDKEAKPIVIGGGTYAKACENIVAFGGLFPNTPDLMHQKDERISLKDLELMANIYLDAIYELAK